MDAVDHLLQRLGDALPLEARAQNRMALGETQSGVVRLVLSRVTMLVAIGVAVGAGISLWASTFVAALLYGLEPRDPATLAGAVLVLSIVGLTAGWLPAHRASRIDPAEVLRDS